MKVLLVNGSPHKEGCTYTALREAAEELNRQDIDTEIFWVGNKPISGCIACGKCRETGFCVIKDTVPEFQAMSDSADGFIFGAPVHYAGISGAMSSFMDRVFYGHFRYYRGKPGAAVVSCRRAGSTAALDRLNKYMTICGMPLVSAQYWSMVHGNTPEEVRRDLEGMQMMRALGKNMAWLLKCIEAGKNAGVEMPELEKRVMTNFIRDI